MASDETYKNTPYRNVHYISLSFFLVFSGVNSALVFGTSDYGNYAAISLAILYTSFALSALFIVPYILNHNILSAKYCTFVGSLVEILFISQYIVFINPYYLYICSFIEGIGISMYWIGSQRFIIQCANHYEKQNKLEKNSEIGTFQGIYFSFYESTTFVSNLLSALLFALKVSNSMVYTMFTIICCIGCGITLFADDINIKDDQDDTQQSKTAQSTVFSTLKQWSSPKLQCLMGLSVYFGIYQQFEYGIFPTLINDNCLKFFVMACYGISGCIFSKYLTKYNSNNNTYCIISGGICINLFIFIFLYIYVGDDSVNNDLNIIYLFVIAALNGIVESSFFVTLFTLYPVICGDSAESLANAQFFQQIGLALGYVLYPLLGFKMKIVFDGMTLFIASIVFFTSKVIRSRLQNKVDEMLIFETKSRKQYDSVHVAMDSIMIVSNKMKYTYDINYMVHHDAESDGYESTYSEI